MLAEEPESSSIFLQRIDTKIFLNCRLQKNIRYTHYEKHLLLKNCLLCYEWQTLKGNGLYLKCSICIWNYLFALTFAYNDSTLLLLLANHLVIHHSKQSQPQLKTQNFLRQWIHLFLLYQLLFQFSIPTTAIKLLEFGEWHWLNFYVDKKAVISKKKTRSCVKYLLMVWSH